MPSDHVWRLLHNSQSQFQRFLVNTPDLNCIQFSVNKQAFTTLGTQKFKSTMAYAHHFLRSSACTTFGQVASTIAPINGTLFESFVGSYHGQRNLVMQKLFLVLLITSYLYSLLLTPSISTLCYIVKLYLLHAFRPSPLHLYLFQKMQDLDLETLK
jgi:hypothetical protein